MIWDFWSQLFQLVVYLQFYGVAQWIKVQKK